MGTSRKKKVLQPQNKFSVKYKKVSSLEEDVDGVISKQVFCQWDLPERQNLTMLNLVNFPRRANLHIYNP